MLSSSAALSAQTDNINTILGNNTGSQSTKDAATLGENFEDFLKLLTTQLQNQDPTQPMETNDFTQQLASLSAVQQQINTNKNLEDLIGMFSISQVNGVVGYIGKQIMAAGNQGVLEGGVAAFAYNLSAPASKVTIDITDSLGASVFSGEGDTKAGDNQVFWNGTNSFTGQQMSDGVYTIKITATDANGKPIDATTYTTGRVTAVSLKDNKPTLEIGTIEIPLDDIKSIHELPSVGTQTASENSNQ